MVSLQLLFRIITRLFAWLRLFRREQPWKSGEILLPRHQLTVLQRPVDAPPKTTWAGPGTARGPARRDPEGPAR